MFILDCGYRELSETPPLSNRKGMWVILAWAGTSSTSEFFFLSTENIALISVYSGSTWIRMQPIQKICGTRLHEILWEYDLISVGFFGAACVSVCMSGCLALQSVSQSNMTSYRLSEQPSLCVCVCGCVCVCVCVCLRVVFSLWLEPGWKAELCNLTQRDERNGEYNYSSPPFILSLMACSLSLSHLFILIITHNIFYQYK